MNSHTIVYKINKNENPVFKIIRAYTKRSKTVNPNTEIKLVAKVEGSISGFNKMQEFVIIGNQKNYETGDITKWQVLTEKQAQKFMVDNSAKIFKAMAKITPDL